MQIGLPLAAIIAATVPVWGMSWYFDTENWAAGRLELLGRGADRHLARGDGPGRVGEEELAKDPARAFAVSPPGIRRATSRSSSSATPARATPRSTACGPQYLEVVRRDDVKFVVISSDVVYPTGAMRHYEANFWLPFMGTTKPVYAIPGNHDWYDALEGFAATFLEPDAARAAMRARVEVDNRHHQHHRRADRGADRARPRGSARSTACRRSSRRRPFFQFQTDSFALFAVDTGVARRVDPSQLAWLAAALRVGARQDEDGDPRPPALRRRPCTPSATTPDFAALHALLREHDVAIVMAGDTHDLEYYAERTAGSSKTAHHFVNGGGGALPEFRHRARLARPAGDGRLGVLPQQGPGRREDRGDDAGLEAARVVVDEAHRGLALLRRVAVGRLRRQRGPVLPELHRGPRRALAGAASASCPTASTAGCAGATWKHPETCAPAGVLADAPVEWVVGMPGQ